MIFQQMRSLLVGPFRYGAACLLGSLAALSGATRLCAEELVATLPGSLSVDNKGAANYSIPLQLPPGRAGLMPQLSLSYSSQAGNGVLGVGWALSHGFPQAITRGRTILARDGKVHGVDFTTADRLYLDGKRLIDTSASPTDATYWTPGAVYRTEVDSFVTITASGANGAIETFVMEDKQGVKYTFGKYADTTDGFQVGYLGNAADTLANVYALKRVEDRVGNFVSFTYTIAGSGEYLLSEIAYTGNGSTAGAWKVVLTHESRTDQTRSYLSGRSFVRTQRLASVEIQPVTANAAQTTKYAFGYEYAGFVKAGSGRSRLASIQLSVKDTDANATVRTVPSTTIRWTDNTKSTAPQTNAFTFPSYADFPGITDWENMVVFGDFNGDGKQDCAVWDTASGAGIKVKLSTGTTWADATVWLTNTTIETLLPGFQTGTATGVGLHMATGDFDGDGLTDLLIYDGSFTKLYVGRSTGTQFAGLGGATTPTLAADVTSRFVDPPNSTTAGGQILLGVEGAGACSRVTVADFTGDGRDDIVITAYDAYLYLYPSTGSGFSAPSGPSSPQTGAAGYADLVTDWNYQVVGTDFRLGPNVRVMPADLNGDGRMDYVVLQTTRTENSGTYPYPSVSYTVMRALKAFLSKSDGTFSDPTTIWNPLLFPINPAAANPIKREEVVLGVLPGDFNGDGLTDYLATIFLPNTGGVSWQLNLSTGGTNAQGRPVFQNYAFVMPNTVTLNAGTASAEVVSTYNQVIRQSAWNSLLSKPEYFLRLPGHTAPSTPASAIQAFHAVESGSLFNTYAMDVNGDCLTDLVWYVDTVADESTAASGAGWWAMLSTGSFSAGVPNGATGSGFVGPVPVPSSLMGGAPGSALTGSTMTFTSRRYSWEGDCDGDGHPDLFGRVTASGRTSGFQALGLTRGASTTSAAVFPDVVDRVTNGIGSQTDIGYLAAKDDSIYTTGAAVSYPIRELRANTPVVSDVYRDSGGSTPAHFSYQYSGHRLDLSGRGDLGFHAFITLDHQTDLFKYQFLTQSFPMTGLTAREETYRYWQGPEAEGSTTINAKFRFISSHDNTVVFDEVVKSPTDTTRWGTVFPFISRAVESRWEDSSTPHFTLSLGAPSSQPESLFAKTKPAGAHITITAESQFDGQAEAQMTLPGPSFTPSDTLEVAETETTPAHRQNRVAGVISFSVITNLNLPGNIYYGNLRKLSTDFGDGFTETVTTEYKPASGALTGLVDSVATTVKSPGYGTESAPTKSYTYWKKGDTQTPLVQSEAVDAAGNKLDLTTTYSRDSRGRITATTITGYDDASDVQYIGVYTASSASTFNGTFDLPTTTADTYGHETTIVYHPTLGQPTSVTDVNNAQTTTEYDALGRVTKVRDELKGLETTTSYTFDSAQTVSPPSGVGGLTLTSKYAVTVTATQKPTVTTYYDRLGRPIRTIKSAFAGEVVVDTIYNLLGQVVAVSNPYPAGGTIYWTKTSYDALGRVSTVTAPNGTVTTNTYLGRATKVSVDAPELGGVDPAAQVNTTLVDAKGRTVKVWNANNVPTFTDALGKTTTAPSITFGLDGFGRMRSTTLKDQTQEITAAYDALGRQTALNDPDKGNWSYLNNTLGLVVKQTDAKSTVTLTNFDRLGRPLTRTTSETAGAVETGNFYYYDTTTDASRHAVYQADKAWLLAPQREESITTGASGYGDPGTTTVHYYDTKGRPSLDLTTIDGKWFYSETDYDVYSRVRHTRHYWRPAGFEASTPAPYAWEDFGYTYSYDAKSYLTTVTDSLNRTWWSNPTYDHLDRVTTVKRGNGHWTKREYRAEDGVLESIKTGPTAGGTVIQNLSFGFDGLGNLTSRGNGSLSETYGYDALNRLTTRNDTIIAAYADNGNLTSKKNVSGTASGAYTYSSSHPHAVESAWGFTMRYDANGNLSTRTGTSESWSLRWSGFDKPRWMARTVGGNTTGSEFLYNAARSRVVHLEFDELNNGVPAHYTRKRIYAVGSTLELNYTNTTGRGAAPVWKMDRVRIYVPGPDGVIGAREFVPSNPFGQEEDAYVYHYDHLGSIEAVTRFGDNGTALAIDRGAKSGRFSEDAWGQRRDPATWSGAPTTTDDGGADSLTPRGFTGHEMLDDLGLVHMNGRIYDPLLGRFLSADLIVPRTGELQSYNRYSYVFNNPLSLIDLNGFDPVPPPMIQHQQAAFQAGHGKYWVAAERQNRGVAVKMLADIAVSHIPYLGTAAAVRQDYDSLKNGSRIERFLAVADLLLIGATLGSENGRGEINAGKTMAKEMRAMEKTTSTEMRAAEQVVKQEASAISHEGASVTRAAEAAPQVGNPATELQGPGLVPDSATVVKGGTKPPPPPGTEFSGSQGPDLESAAAGVPHGQVQATTAGEIRRAGGTVTPVPEPTGTTMNYQHVNVEEAKTPTVFTPPQPNPVPKDKRIGSPGYQNP